MLPAHVGDAPLHTVLPAQTAAKLLSGIQRQAFAADGLQSDHIR